MTYSLELLSLGCFAATVLTVAVMLCMRKRKNILAVLTGGVYLTLLLLFVTREFGKEQGTTVYKMAVSLHGAFKVFGMGQSPSVILELADAKPEWIPCGYTDYLTGLFVLAPVLTFSNVLSLFRNAADKVRFATYIGKEMYIMSELNPRSLALAESIRAKKAWAMIVFAGVGAAEEKAHADLVGKARDLDAVCLERTLPNIKMRKFWQKKQVFLINQQETESVACAIKLVDAYKNSKQKMDIYVYASAPGSNETIDSLDKGRRVLHTNFQKELKKKLPDILATERNGKLLAKLPLEGKFSIRCINPVEQTVRNILEKNYETIIESASANENTISIAILGGGNHGLSMLKTACWIFQLYGYRLECNVFDMDGSVEKHLSQEAPDLKKKHKTLEHKTLRNGDAYHDIRFFGGTDCMGSDFDDCLQKNWDRFEKTQLVFVAMGDDSKNIATALHTRGLFLRKKINKELERAAETQQTLEKQQIHKELPLICAIVTDIRMSENLNQKRGQSDAFSSLKDLNNKDYNIQLTGTLPEVYAYDRIKQITDLEKQALRHHLAWSLNKMKEAEAQGTSCDEQADELVANTQKYMNHSYFRNSSVAMAVHQRLLSKIRKVILKEVKDTFQVEIMEETKPGDAGTEKEQLVCMITEHMRWNAYMRSRGYSYCSVRDNRAKLHPLMVLYDDLSDADKKKDLVDYEEEVEHVHSKTN